MSIKAFIDSVRSVMSNESSTSERIQEEIETSYDHYIVNAKISKADFLAGLYERDRELHELTVNHLFTPIHWSKVSMHIAWGLKNTATGNLVSLCLKDEDDDMVFVIRDSGDELSYSPMIVSDNPKINEFLSILKRSHANEDVEIAAIVEDDTYVDIELEYENINPVNLELVRIQLIY